MGLKLAVVGGGSTYTPELVDGFARRTDRVAVDEIALLDIDPERLAIVGGLAERMLARQGWAGRVLQTTDRDAAIDGADFVLVQLRVGGQRARLGDETMPPRFGLIGQETVGVGGFAKALRTVPVVLELAEAVARRSRAGRLDRRLHEPRRDRHPGPARCRPPEHRPVQRRDRVPAPLRRPVRRRAGAGRARAGRAQPPHLDPGGPGRRRRSPRGAPGRWGRALRPTSTSRPSGSSPTGRSRRTTCATTMTRRESWPRRGPRRPGPRR